MLIEENEQTEQGTGTWLWSDCKLVLRRTNPNKPSEESYQNLEAEVQLQSDQIQEPFIPLFTFSKSFYFNKKGFYCKKGIPLPSLAVKLQKSYLQLLQDDEKILMIYCELTVAYPRRKETHFYLEEVKTLGNKKKTFSPDGTVQFDGIVIKESSMQRANSKFSFLVSICASSIEQNKIIFKTLISTAFYSETPRIMRKSYKKSYKLTQLVAPTKFQKPICQLKSSMKFFSKQTLLSTLKYLNEREQKLNFRHPFYLIYHFSNVLKVFYHSHQINGLSQLLELISSQRNQENMANGKKTFITYELRKTKKIKKTCHSISVHIKFRKKITIYGKIQNGNQFIIKPLLVTFNNDILQLINEEINEEIEDKQQKVANTLREELQDQVAKLNDKFNKSTYFYLKVDLLRQEPLQNYWKDIQKEAILQAYKNHYQMIYTKLKQNTLNKIQNNKEVN